MHNRNLFTKRTVNQIRVNIVVKIKKKSSFVSILLGRLGETKVECYLCTLKKHKKIHICVYNDS